MRIRFACSCGISGRRWYRESLIVPIHSFLHTGKAFIDALRIRLELGIRDIVGADLILKLLNMSLLGVLEIEE